MQDSNLSDLVDGNGKEIEQHICELANDISLWDDIIERADTDFGRDQERPSHDVGQRGASEVSQPHRQYHTLAWKL